jgi:hypothetical protein
LKFFHVWSYPVVKNSVSRSLDEENIFLILKTSIYLKVLAQVNDMGGISVCQVEILK